MNKTPVLLLTAAMLSLSQPSRAALVYSESNLGIPVPDNDAGGILRTLDVTGLAFFRRTGFHHYGGSPTARQDR